MSQHGGIEGMDENFGPGGVFELLITADVIEMAMGVDNIFQGQSGPSQGKQNPVCLIPGIDDCGYLCLLAPDNETISHEGTQRQFVNDQFPALLGSVCFHPLLS